MDYTFKALSLSEPVRIWLQEIYKNGEAFDAKKAKAKLRKGLPRGFNARIIDSRLCRSEHLTLIGIWHIDPESLVFSNVTRVIENIREAIMREPEVKTITAIQIAARTRIKESDVESALFLMSEMGRFHSGATGSGRYRYSSISFSESEEDIYDEYLYFDNLENVMEEFYTRRQRSVADGFSGAASHHERDGIKANTAFIIVSMDSAVADSEDVCSLVKRVCRSFDIDALCADDVADQTSITDTVLAKIRESEFLIADLSYDQPNVYYEIGYARALGRRPILYRKENGKSRFDPALHEVSEFKDSADLQEKLVTRLESILGRKR